MVDLAGRDGGSDADRPATAPRRGWQSCATRLCEIANPKRESVAHSRLRRCEWCFGSDRGLERRARNRCNHSTLGRGTTIPRNDVYAFDLMTLR